MISGRIENRDARQSGDAEEFLVLLLEFFVMVLVAVDDVAAPQEKGGLIRLGVLENLRENLRLW